MKTIEQVDKNKLLNAITCNMHEFMLREFMKRKYCLRYIYIYI